MSFVRELIPGRFRLLLALSLVAVRAAAAAEPPTATSPFAPGSLAARGPLALAVAAEPRGLHWAFETGFPLGLGRGGAAGPRRIEGPWRLDALLDASHDRESAGDPGGLGTSLRLERSHTRGTSWWGVARGGPRQPGAPGARLQLGLGRFHAFSGVRAEVAWTTSSVLFRDDPRWFQNRALHFYTPPVDSFAAFWTDTTLTKRASHAAFWNTAQAALRWQRGRLGVESVGGLSLGEGVRARHWAQATMSVQLSRRVLLMASLGERPAPALAFHSGAQPRTMLGLQLAPWSGRGWAMRDALRPVATAWQAQRVGRDQLLVRVHGRDVSRVELSGDFTDWTPPELMPVDASWWAAVVRVPPGVHRVQIRLDGGAWLAPPGLPRADDGPGGPSGTLIVTAEE